MAVHDTLGVSDLGTEDWTAYCDWLEHCFTTNVNCPVKISYPLTCLWSGYIPSHLQFKSHRTANFQVIY